MRVAPLVLLSCLTLVSASVFAQARTQTPARRAAPAPATKTEAPEMTCPAVLGKGVSSGRDFCDVLTGATPADGIVITLPPHRGPVTLTFDLHNRHTYSEEQTKDPRTAFARYTAVIGALTEDNTLIRRAAIQSEFRSATDLLDRVSGGAGPAGVKAVAPIGLEPIKIEIPQEENKVSILGEKLTVERAEGTATYSSAGRPIAIVSNVMITYRPAPAPAPRRATPARPAPRRPGQ